MKLFTNFTNTRSVKMHKHYVFRYSDALNIFTKNKDLVIRGSGTSYNDIALKKDGNVIITKNLNKILNFNIKRKTITCQSGLILSDLLKVILPQKLFLHSSPGTYRASIGGLVATDAHGKNSKNPFFSKSVLSLKILTPNNKILKCSRKNNEKLFFSTIGGFGLTGIILEIEFKLIPIPSLQLEKKTCKFYSISQMLSLMNKLKMNYDYIYTIHNTNRNQLNKGYVIGGKFIKSNKSRYVFGTLLNIRFLKIPIINKLSIYIFNLFLHNFNSKQSIIKKINIIDFFYPLEKIKYWENLYGNNGFYEYQVFVPKDNFKVFLNEIMNDSEISKSFSFLSSTKFISKSEGFFSCKNEQSYNFAIDLLNNKYLKKNYQKLLRLADKHNCNINFHKDLFLNNKDFFNLKNLKTFKKNSNLNILNSNFSKRVRL